MSATVASALKKVVVAVLTDKNLRKTFFGIVLGVIVVIVMPFAAIIALFQGDITIDTDRLQTIVVQNLSAEEKARLRDVESLMYEIEDKITAAGFDAERVKEAQVLYVMALAEYASDGGFADRLVGWFDPESGKIGYATNGMPDIGADSMYISASEKGSIATMPDIPGLAVWHKGHIGIYIGNGQVIHASGTLSGVVQTPIGASGWTHWLKIPYITYYENSVDVTANESHIWSALYAKIGNAYGVAGLMGNLYAESGLLPNNLQDSYEAALGYSDSAYTQAVDSGSYTSFANDSAGYGLAQWTASDRKRDLLAFANERGCSIADLDMQLDFLCEELETKFPGVLSVLKNAQSVREASDYVLFRFEAPLDQSESVQIRRAANGSVYYNRYG